MRAMESQDPDRHLVGFEDRLKGRDRIKEKVYDTMEEVRLPRRGGPLKCARHNSIYL